MLFVRPERVRGRVRSSQKLGLCLNCLPVVFTNLNYGHVNDTVVPWPRVRTRSLRQQPKISRLNTLLTHSNLVHRMHFQQSRHKTIAVVDKVAHVRPCRLKTLRGWNWLVAQVVRVYHKPRFSMSISSDKLDPSRTEGTKKIHDKL